MTQRIRELWRPADTILALEDVPEKERLGIRSFFLQSMSQTQTGFSEAEEVYGADSPKITGYYYVP
jgi:hypothetical protein